MKNLLDNILLSGKSFEVHEENIRLFYKSINTLLFLGVSTAFITILFLYFKSSFHPSLDIFYHSLFNVITLTFPIILLRYLGKKYANAIVYIPLVTTMFSIYWVSGILEHSALLTNWYLILLMPLLHFFNRTTVILMFIYIVGVLYYHHVYIGGDRPFIVDIMIHDYSSIIFGTIVAIWYYCYMSNAVKKLEKLNAELEEKVKAQTLERTKTLEGEKKILNYQAHYDYLTSLPNRSLFQKTLDEIFNVKNVTLNCALLFIDLNRFKSFNDTHGHAIGDSVLQIVAKRISALLDEEMKLFRLGGDEFVLIVEDFESKKSLEVLCEKIMYTLEKPTNIAGKTLNLSCAIGLSIAPQDTQIKEAFIRYADLAMLEAKKFPNGKYLFYETLAN